MNIYLIYLFVLLSLLLILKLGSRHAIRLNRAALPAVCVLFILLLIFFPVTSVEAAVKGVRLWLEIVFPSLFPFFVASELLNKSGMVRAFGILLEPLMRPLFNVPGCGSFAFAMGISSGYPVGATITAEMRSEKLLTRTEAERLLTFTNNSGPLFIIGAVSVGMFRMPEIGLFMLFCHIAACITVGSFFRFYKRKEKSFSPSLGRNIFSSFRKELAFNLRISSSNLGSLLGDSVKNSVSILLSIGGFIVLFSVIINLLLKTGVINGFSEMIFPLLSQIGIGTEIIKSVLSGFFEITTGTNMASHAAGATLLQQLTATSLIIGWAGLSVHSQVWSITSKTDISIKPYLTGKFLQGIFAAIYTFAGIKIAGSLFLIDKPAFSGQNPVIPLNWQGYIVCSFEYLVFSLCLLSVCILLSIIFFILKRK